MARTGDGLSSSRSKQIETRSNEHAAALAEELLGALVVISADGAIAFWNAGARALYGYSDNEALRRSLLELTVAPNERDAFSRWLQDLEATGSGTHAGMRLREDGSSVYVQTVARVVRDGAPSEVLLVLNERDASRFLSKREDTDSGKKTEERFRDLLEAAPDAMVIVDRSGRIMLVNSQTETLFGYKREELLGLAVDVLVPTPLRDTHINHRGKYFADPHRRPMGSGLALAGRRKDGSEFPVEISLSPVHTEDGLLVTAAVRDISSRVNVEQQLKTANLELEAFTYSVSHDLRAPIRQIDGFSSILTAHLGEGVDEKTKHYLRRIREGSQNMGRLVDDLLNLSRVGRSDVHPRVISLGAVVRDVLSDLQPEYATRDVEWRIETLPTVEYDPGLIKLVFTNLLANALKYTRPREVATIEIGAAPYRVGSLIHVRDNGVGFDMKYADKLFGVFQRLHHPDEFEGAGVGLATVQRIVRKHGGEIWAEAEPDKGAAFFFTVGPSIKHQEHAR